MHFHKYFPSHLFFVKAAKNEYAVLTGYPTSHVGSVHSETKRSLVRSVPVMGGALIEGDNETGMLRFQEAQEVYMTWPQRLSFVLGGSPMLVPFFAAGLSFSRGHRIARVPYGKIPGLFIGEEILYTLQLFTEGYDMYTFVRNSIFHVYPWDRAPGEQAGNFWEEKNVAYKALLEAASLRYTRDLMQWHVPPLCDEQSVRQIERSIPCDLDDMFRKIASHQGLGGRRALQAYYDIFAVHPQHGMLPRVRDYVVDGTAHQRIILQCNTDVEKGIDYGKVPRDVLQTAIWEAHKCTVG